MVVGIIAAEIKEMTAIKEIMQEISEEKIFNLTFLKGKIRDKDCVLVKSGVGKVNSARTNQIMIDKYNINYIINVGSAGSANAELNIKDIVIGDKLVQYDFDITGAGNYEKGEICDVGKFFYSDKRMINLCNETINELKDRDFNIKIGTIASADLFCTDSNLSKKIREDFGAECVEMEGAAIAQVCTLDKVPFLVIRGISDTPNGNNHIDFVTYLESVSKSVAKILYKLISKI